MTENFENFYVLGGSNIWPESTKPCIIRFFFPELVPEPKFSRVDMKSVLQYVGRLLKEMYGLRHSKIVIFRKTFFFEPSSHTQKKRNLLY